MPVPHPRCFVLLLAGAAGHVLAQEASPEPDIARVEIKGGAASYDPRRDDTAARILVGREEIARYDDTSVFEVFRRIPGVTVTHGGARGLEVRMRGLGGGYTQILLNGERTPAGFTLDNLSPDLIERIEVLRVASAEYSTESVAGTINIVLRKTVRKREREAKLGYLLSRDFRGPTFSAEVADRAERSSYSLSVSGNHDGLSREVFGDEEYRQADGDVAMRRATVVPERGRMNRLNVNPRFGWTLDNGDTLTWDWLANSSSFRHQRHPRVTTLAGAPPPVPDLRTSGEMDDRALQSDLGWTHALAGGTKLEAKLGATWSSRKVFQTRAGEDSAGVAATDGSVLLDTHARGLNSTGKASHGLDSGHQLAVGWDIRADESDDIRVERDRVRLLPTGQRWHERFHARTSRAAVYVQDEWTINPAWSVYLGTRWEGVRTRVAGDGFVPARLSSNVLSPIVQALWKRPGKKEGQSDGLRLAISRTYKAPDLFSLVPRRAAWENNSPTEADYQGNPNLKPELAWGLDASWERYWAEGAMLSVSGSLRRIEDYTSNRIYFDGTRWIFTPVNEDRALTRGIELETKFPLKAWLPDAPALDLRASVSRNWSRVESVPGPYNRMEQQAPLTANLGLDYKAGALGAGASLAHRRGGFVRVATNRGFYSVARTDLEAYALWTFTPRLKLRVALSNLLGEDDAFVLSYADLTGGTEKRSWNYPSGAKLRTTLEMTF